MWIAYLYNGGTTHEWADTHEQAIRLAKRWIVRGFANPFMVSVTLLGKGGRKRYLRAGRRDLSDNGSHPSPVWYEAPSFETCDDSRDWRAV